MIELERQANWYRPLFIDGSKEISKFVFFANGEIITEVKSGFLVNGNFGDTISIELNDLKKKIKIDLHYEGNFYVSNRKDYSGTTYTVYLYMPNYKKLEDIKDKIKEGYFYIYNNFEFPLRNKREHEGKLVQYNDIKLKVFSHKEQTEEYKKGCEFEEKVYKKMGLSLSMDQIKEIVKMYNEYKDIK